MQLLVVVDVDVFPIGGSFFNLLSDMSISSEAKRQRFASKTLFRSRPCAACSDKSQAARRQSITRAIHACCSGSRRRAYGDQLRRRSAIDTSAASALSGTVKPALWRPFGVSTKTRRRRCGIELTIARQPARATAGSRYTIGWNGSLRRASPRDFSICRNARVFSKSLLELLHRKNLLGAECPPSPFVSGTTGLGASWRTGPAPIGKGKSQR